MELNIADIPEKFKNTHISSLGSDGLHWTVVHTLKSKSEKFLYSSHRKKGFEEKE